MPPWLPKKLGRFQWSRRPLILATAVILGAGGVLLSKRALTPWVLSLYHRPALGSDAELLKSTLDDLYAENSRSYRLAGELKFPLDTDGVRPISRRGIEVLSAQFHSELSHRIMYGHEEAGWSEMEVQTLLGRSTPHTITIPSPGRTSTRSRIQRVRLTPRSTQPIRMRHLALLAPGESPAPLYEVTGRTRIEQILNAFARLVRLKRNGHSPLGQEFKISFGELVEVHGYGQCHNLSSALASLLMANGIETRLVHLPSPTHTLTEAHLRGDRWVALDPLLELAFLDRKGGLSFLEVQRDLEKALQRFSPAAQVSEKVRFYYSPASPTYETTPPTTPERRDYTLQPGESVEYDFAAGAPWVALRNIKTPPEEVPGTLRHIIPLKGKRPPNDGSIDLELEMPYPIVDAELHIPPGAPRPMIYMEGSDEPLSYEPEWQMVRLRRGLHLNRVQYRTRIRLQFPPGTNRIIHPFKLVVLSQISRLPFHLKPGARMLIDAVPATSFDVEVKYAQRKVNPSH